MFSLLLNIIFWDLYKAVDIRMCSVLFLLLCDQETGEPLKGCLSMTIELWRINDEQRGIGKHACAAESIFR